MPPKRKAATAPGGSDGSEAAVNGKASDGASDGKASNNGHTTEGALDGKPPDETDHANYFCEYAYLYHQMDMLEDTHRTGSYHNAILWNAPCFEGKVVLDVGAGSGILSIMAAKAGAAKVFAVEATDIAQRARKIVAANGLDEVIQVLQGTVETVHLPCKVDVIVSEWMGYFLLRESMLDSVLAARDKFLKPGGSLFPSHATLYLAPVDQHKVLKDRWQLWEGEKQHWETFAADMMSSYETDFSCVEKEFMQEQRKYYLQTGAFMNLTPKQLAGPGRPLMELDLATLTLDELKQPADPLRCSMKIAKAGPIEGFTGYFDVAFRGSEASPAEQEVTLTTAPTPGTSTHWGQQLFGFYPPMKAQRGDVLEAEVVIGRQKHNHRLLRLQATFSLYAGSPSKGSGAGAAEDTQRGALREQRTEEYFVD